MTLPMEPLNPISRRWVYGRSEGFPRTGYFIPGRDGMGAWLKSGVIHAAARALFGDLRAFPQVFGGF